MRRKVVLALCASAIAAPIPVAALAQTGPDVGDVAAKAVMRQGRAAQGGTHREARGRAPRGREAPGEGRGPRSPIPPQLEAIAACESGGDPTAVSADGTYHGKYQFW